MTFNKLVLFDIDGTLLSRSNGHIEAFAVAFKQVFNKHASIYMIKYQGLTDQQIIRGVMQKSGVTSAKIDAKMPECIQAMCNYFEAIRPYVKADVLPGAADALAALESDGALLGLVTGNLEPIAHGKLKSAGIDHYFKLGGYGSDAEERPKLVEKAKQRAVKEFNFQIKDNVYLVGDAPQDMQAATQADAKAIGVATGIYTKNELHEAGAYRVVNDLTDKEELLRF